MPEETFETNTTVTDPQILIKTFFDTYGENYTEKNGAFVYSSGGMELRFIFDSNDACISIEYASTVLNE